MWRRRGRNDGRSNGERRSLIDGHTRRVVGLLYPLLEVRPQLSHVFRHHHDLLEARDGVGCVLRYDDLAGACCVDGLKVG